MDTDAIAALPLALDDDDVIPLKSKRVIAVTENPSAGSDSGSEDESGSDGEDSDGPGSDNDNEGSKSNANTGDGADDDSDDGFVRRKRPTKRPRKPRAPGVKSKVSSSGGPAKKRKRKTYVEEAAEVAGDEEDEEEDEEYAALKKAGVSRDDYQARVIARIEAENQAMQAKRKSQKTAEEIAADIEEKYAGGAYKIGEEDYAISGAVASQANLPDMRDPKLWMMRCKDGSEMMVLIALLNKFVVKAEGGERLGIMSAVNTAKGVIFVEAYREAQVRQSIAGIADLYGWKPDAIKLVPVPQMTAALYVSAGRDVFKRNMFVRFARGNYKGDLAQVIEVLEGGSKLLLRAVPRINYKALALPREQRKAVGRKAGSRPAQRFYDRKEYVDESNGDADILNVLKWGMRVDKIGANYYGGVDGMMYKEVRVEHVTAHGPAPSMDEISQFKAKKDDTENDSMAARDPQSSENALLDTLEGAKAGMTDVAVLEPGDSVVVVTGDLTGLSGHVVVVNPGGTFTLQPSAESSALLEIDDKLEIACHEVAKTFDVGDHVKVLNGMFKRETGTVLASRPVIEDKKVSAFIATILLDSGQKTVEVFVKDLSESTEVVTSVTSVDGYELHDLVEIKGVTESKPDAGCVVELRQRELKILLSTGTVQNIAVQEIRGKANYRGATGMAVAQGQQLAVGDVIRVIQGSGDIANLTGTIKHIYGMRLFCHSYALVKNSGIFVVRPQQVVLASRKSHAEQKAQVMTTVGRLFSGPRGKGKGDLGRSVLIVRGRWKGRLGMIRNETDTHFSVELHQAQQKHVTIARAECKVIGDERGAVGGPATASPLLLGSATPHLGGATPGQGGMTPGYGMGSATPMPGMGGATPMFGSKTPFGGGATPMYGAGGATPMFAAGAQTPFIGGGKTPMLGGMTPLYRGGMTPAIGGGGRTPAGMAAPVNPAELIMAAMVRSATAAGINSDTDVVWCDKGVKVNIVSGQYAGKTGVVRAVSTIQPTTSVFLDNVGQNVTVPISDLQPQLAVPNSYARVLQGALTGQRLYVMNTTGVGPDGQAIEDEDADVVLRKEDGEADVLPRTAVVRCEAPNQ